MRRQAVQDELERLAPPADPQLTQAEEVLANFATFWEREDSPAERHRLLATLFENVRQDEGKIVYVKPRPTFVPYFQTLTETPENRSGFSGVQSGSDGGLSRTFAPRRLRHRRLGHAAGDSRFLTRCAAPELRALASVQGGRPRWDRRHDHFQWVSASNLARRLGRPTIPARGRSNPLAPRSWPRSRRALGAGRGGSRRRSAPAACRWRSHGTPCRIRW
jgi:hypothetical protein